MRNRILILGGSYFIGRRVAEHLYSIGMEVTILNRGTNPVPLEGIKQIVCDRNDSQKLKQVLEKKMFDIVIDISWKDISWVKSFCEALDFSTVKTFIFLSSSAVYDVEHLHIPFSENDSLAANKYWTSYGSGKIEAELYYRDYLFSKPANLIILRPPYIYGEYNYAQRESLMFRQIMDNQPILIPRSNPKLQFIYTSDLAYIISTLLLHNKEKLAVYNVGNLSEVTALEWADLCGFVAGYKPTIISVDYKSMSKNIRDFYPFYDYDNVLNVNKIHAICPKETPLEIGLKSAYQWFVSHRNEIQFKPNVDENMKEMIMKCSIND